MHFFFANALRCWHFPLADIFFQNSTASHTRRHYLQLWRIEKIQFLERFLFCFICNLLVTETCISRVFPYMNIGHHTSSNTGRLEIFNTMKKESIRAYYRSIPRESSIKRITWIVSQNLQKAKQLTATTSTSKTAMSQTIVDNRMRYTKKSPEERKPAKFSQAACLKEDTCSSGTNDHPGEAIPYRLNENGSNLQ